jgi:hypothetical protein
MPSVLRPELIPGLRKGRGQTLRATTTDAYFSGVMRTTGNSRSVNS